MNTQVIKEYYCETESVSSNKQVASDCSGILFVNKGANVVRVNDLPLSQDEALSYTPDDGVEIDRTKYIIRFEDSGGTDLLYIVRKKYEGLNYER